MKFTISKKLFFIFLVALIFTTRFCFPVCAQSSLSANQLIDLSEQRRDEGDIKEATRFLNEAAVLCWESKNYQAAIEYFSRSSKLNKQINNESGIDKINSNLAMIYSDLLDYEKALEYFQFSLDYRKRNKLTVETISTLINVAVVLNSQKRHNSAAEHLEQALKLATEMNDAQQMKSCYGMLAETYEKAGDEARTLHYFGLYRTFHEMIQKTKETDYKQEIEKSKLEALLKEAENKNKDLELQIQQKQLTNASKELVAVSKDVKSLVDSLSKNELAVALLKKQNQVKEFQLRENITNQKNQFTTFIFSLSAFCLTVFLLLIIYRADKSRKKTNDLLNKRNEEMKSLSENLDQLVIERTLELRSALEKLNRRNKLLSQFSSMLAKRLEQPISKMIEVVSLLKSNPQVEKVVLTASSELLFYSKELSSIVSDLSQVNSLNDAEGDEITNVSIPSVFSAVINALKDRVEKVEAKVTIEYNGINSVKGIRSFVENVLFKLVAKSLATNDEVQTPVVVIKVLKLKGMACISVSDNRIGGTMNKQIHIKEKTTDVLDLEGNGNSAKGIGFFLVQSELEAMDGSLEMDIIPEIGTVARVFLPLADEAPKEVKDINSQISGL